MENKKQEQKHPENGHGCSKIFRKENKMRKPLYLFFIAAIFPALLVSACSGKLSESRLARIEKTQAPFKDIEQLINDNTAFAFELYQALQGSDGNLVYSPYSISLAFAMAYAGAGGETASQMADVLHYSLPPEQFHPAFNALDLDLSRRAGQGMPTDKKDRFELTIANALWGQAGWTFLPEYLDLLASNYGAGIRLVDFKKSPESARRQINDWVSDQTKKRIKDIIPVGMPDPRTRLVQANAIYFKATWMNEFDHAATQDAPFTLLGGETVKVSMMSQDHARTFRYASGDGWQAIALPYKGGLTEMDLIIPDKGAFEAVEVLLPQLYHQIKMEYQPQEVALSMPKFNFTSPLGLKDKLTGMGMRDAFDRDLANFSGMDGKRDLYIGEALHKAFIAVDEKGTEAAAATVLVAMEAALMPEPISLTIDRPFFFFIRDVPAETILFMGRVVDPR
jgi:serpin B